MPYKTWNSQFDLYDMNRCRGKPNTLLVYCQSTGYKNSPKYSIGDCYPIHADINGNTPIENKIFYSATENISIHYYQCQTCFVTRVNENEQGCLK